MKLKYAFIFIGLILSLSFVTSEDFGIGNPNTNGFGFGSDISGGSTTSTNYSLINVNNSLYWQGHTGTDGSWLTGILYSESDPIWNANSTLVSYLANNNIFTALLNTFVNIQVANITATNRCVSNRFTGYTNSSYGTWSNATDIVIGYIGGL
jgi:hypothetical protein